MFDPHCVATFSRIAAHLSNQVIVMTWSPYFLWYDNDFLDFFFFFFWKKNLKVFTDRHLFSKYN